ncbi:homeobox protein 2-like [Leptopilina boulardi]|uniref:homeobox protein 2-like n=1 Tax=Leptopilina boulardi TaxID=63433 RepID=UPI0021F68AD5|nr:homeobox protein 2-like [Leptopilina boulardi]
MARKKVGLKIYSDSIDQNESILRELQMQKQVDERSPKDLKELFNNLNTNNISKNGRDDDKFAAFSNTHEATGNYGPIADCPSGTWWGIRVDCSRQGVHKPFNLDIHDGPFGAISICTPQNSESKDVDLGEILTITGREYSELDASNESLILNFQRCVPLRLVRSYSLSNVYSPKTGYRYDGLYIVIAHWIGESENSKKHKFALSRLQHQESPSWLNNNNNSMSTKSTTTTTTTTNVKQLPKKLSCTLRKRSSKKINSQTISSIVNNEKYNNCEKNNKKLSESPSISQNGIAILTRQVFKKPTAASTTPPVSRSLIKENLSQNSFTYKQVGQSKLLNTNIAVRTDLYDSFHNVQQDIKKTSTFSRVYKSNHQIEKIDETQLLEINEKTLKNNCLISQRENIIEKTMSRESIYQIVGCPLNDKTEENNFPIINNKETKNCPEKRNSISSNSSNSLEALTPDKILNLVVKEKRNPMAKLLIGNVIGLSIEESSVIKAYNALISKENKESNNSEHIDNSNGDNNNRLKASSNFKMISKRILRHNRNDENRKNYSKLSKRNRGCNNDNGQIINNGANSKFNDDPGGVIGYSKSMKRTQSKITENSSKITKKSSACKKQRREIANLVIDANVGPIIRGPRNRRLRCRKIIGKDSDGFISNTGFQKRRGILNKPAKRSELSKRRKRMKAGINKSWKLQTGNINLNLSRGKQRKSLENTRNFQDILTRNTDVQRINVESVDHLTKKSRMVDAVSQCSLITEPTINSCSQMNIELDHSSDLVCNNERLSVTKVEEVYLDDIKSEEAAVFSDDNENDDDEDDEVNDNDDDDDDDNNSVDSHEYLNGFENEETFSNSKTSERLTVDQELESVYNIYPLIHRESAFVPVNSSSSLKIARLRSIGFRPIQMEDEREFNEDNNFSRISNNEENSDSITKEADEEYNKYTNDSTSDVGYMDDDLHYEDIENEDTSSDVSKRKDYFPNGDNNRFFENEEEEEDEEDEEEEENFDKPWHGWKKISSKNGDQWIGW